MLFPEYRDISQIPIRRLLRLGIVPVGKLSSSTNCVFSEQEQQYDDSEVPEETEEVDFEQWTRCGLAKPSQASGRNTKKRRHRSSHLEKTSSELNGSGDSDTLTRPEETSNFRIETTFPLDYLENTVSAGDMATASPF